MQAATGDVEQLDDVNETELGSRNSSSTFRTKLEKFACPSSSNGLPPRSSPVVTSSHVPVKAMPPRSFKENKTESIDASKHPSPEQPISVPRKRKSSQIDIPTDTLSPSPKRRTTTKERSARDPHSPKNLLVDSLRPDLTLVFIGLNPGLTTAATGHAYAHRSNLFWKILHQSGITPTRHEPKDTRNLLDLYNIGNTNLCTRPTRAGDGLSRQEQAEGAVIVEEKIRDFKPEAVCIVGKGIWDVIWKVKTGKKLTKETFRWGWQDEDMSLGREVDKTSNVVWKGARTFVATSTSGLAASLRPTEKLAIWEPLGQWVCEKRKG